jgi:hypothetical protein
MLTSTESQFSIERFREHRAAAAVFSSNTRLSTTVAVNEQRYYTETVRCVLDWTFAYDSLTQTLIASRGLYFNQSLTHPPAQFLWPIKMLRQFALVLPGN